MSYSSVSIRMAQPGMLDVRAAEVFVAVAEELHFGRAADRLYMTQPGVSRHISRLEAALGLTLLRRTNRHVELTREGHVFLTSARDVLVSARRAVEAAQLAARGGAGQLPLGSAGTLPNELAVRLVRAFRAIHPAVEVQLVQSSYITCPLGGLDRGSVELAVVRAPLSVPGLMFEPLMQEARLVALSARHHLADRASVTVADLAGEPIVTSDSWSRALRDYWAGVDDGADPSYGVAVAAPGPGEWLAALAEGQGVSLCPGSIAGYYQRQDVAYVRVEDLRPCTVGLAWRAGDGGPILGNFVASATSYLATHNLRGWMAKE
ncbi:MAG: LysR family transcriptional regulator [Solirubrobacterales bacterium]|nr:LysR family transcriptional regulator [Solirubrobacterales bacterium]